MEIPYVVEPRKDTGLNNSKIAIWLFLASEVMLFGGLFSGYIFLRIFADYPWPERTLPVLPGLINTFVLIGSSVTVVFAWVSLKLRQWRKFQIYMSITIICAALFMVLKGIEYNAKFHHQAIRLDDYTVVEGHAYAQDGSHDKKKPVKNLNITAESIEIDLDRVDDAYYETMGKQYDQAKFILSDDVQIAKDKVLKKGTAISKELLDEAKSYYKNALAHNSNIDIELGRKAWKAMKAKYPEKKYYEIVEGGKTLKEATSAYLKTLKEEQKDNYRVVTPSLTFVPSSGSALITVNPYWGRLSNPRQGAKGTLTLKDETLITGIT
ncbi:MAG: cytochrome c oxidase subunit 3, partial [Verrucomicrobiae bacterium]|nr:cytochrome c oxidase subunit 3 [Verrucomicrobiae bacterium]NNJ85969.1 heme-copper oxidase subunit III [Akkermansiaceae bacterium]